MFESTDRPELLVSVRNLPEAEAAREGGADIIDVKEPNHGPLGCANPDVLAAIMEAPFFPAGLRRTAALGELIDVDISIVDGLPAGWHALKVGLASARQLPDWKTRFRKLAARLAAKGPLLPVAYADAENGAAPPVAEVLACAIECRVPYVLIDTFKKDGRGLLDYLTPNRLAEISSVCRTNGLPLALAGSLSMASLAEVLPIRPQVIAVRGAACEAGVRSGMVTSQRVRLLREAMDAGQRSVVLPARVL